MPVNTGFFIVLFLQSIFSRPPIPTPYLFNFLGGSTWDSRSHDYTIVEPQSCDSTNASSAPLLAQSQKATFREIARADKEGRDIKLLMF